MITPEMQVVLELHMRMRKLRANSQDAPYKAGVNDCLSELKQILSELQEKAYGPEPPIQVCSADDLMNAPKQ